MSKYFLLKSEPETYSIEQLKSDKKTNWNGVRNFQARNVLLTAEPGDRALIYHSGKDKAVVGIAKITSKAFPDLDLKKKGDWVQVEIAFESFIANPVPLSILKSDTKLKNLALLKQSQLSCMPVSKIEFEHILKLGSKKTSQ